MKNSIGYMLLRIVGILSVFMIAPCGNDNDEYQQSDISHQVHLLVNQHRTSQGLDTLAWNDVVAGQCATHSRDMADGAVPFGHDGFSERIDNIAQEMTVLGAGENVAYNSGMEDPAQAAVDAWLSSTGHRQNIEGDYQLTGVGVASNDGNTYFITQIFIRSE